MADDRYADNNIPEQREYIKLIKNTKGFNWEVKILANRDGELGATELERLGILNEELESMYGSTAPKTEAMT